MKSLSVRLLDLITDILGLQRVCGDIGRICSAVFFLETLFVAHEYVREVSCVYVSN